MSKQVILGWFCETCKVSGEVVIRSSETYTKFHLYVDYCHSHSTNPCQKPVIHTCRPSLIPEDCTPWDKDTRKRCDKCGIDFMNQNFYEQHIRDGCKG